MICTTNTNFDTTVLNELQDYMFTSINIDRYSKHIIKIDLNLKSSTKNFEKYLKFKDNNKNEVYKDTNITKAKTKIDDKLTTTLKNKLVSKVAAKTAPKPAAKTIPKIETMYKPKQKDSLFWCFYILKNGFSNYEMEINNHYFTVEKDVKFSYIQALRQNKDLLKIHKIKPFTELEYNLAHDDRITIKTFFALCAIEKINVLLINKRKVYELLCSDITNNSPLKVIHRNSDTYEHTIEINPTNEAIHKYKNSFYIMESFESKLKSINSYKLDELKDLCNKLDININATKGNTKKVTKKDIYEHLVMNY